MLQVEKKGKPINRELTNCAEAELIIKDPIPNGTSIDEHMDPKHVHTVWGRQMTPVYEECCNNCKAMYLSGQEGDEQEE